MPLTPTATTLWETFKFYFLKVNGSTFMENSSAIFDFPSFLAFMIGGPHFGKRIARGSKIGSCFL